MANRENDQKNKPSFLKTQRFAKVLLDVTNQLAASNNLDEALATLVNITSAAVEAERGTIFLNDEYSGELYSRVAQGDLSREIRILNNAGVAGWVFTNQEGVIIDDAYSDERFDRHIDEQTGFETKKHPLCASDFDQR